MAQIPPRGDVGMESTVTRVPFGADLTVRIRRLRGFELEGGDDETRYWCMVAAWIHLSRELFVESGFDLLGAAADVVNGKIAPIDDDE